MNIIRKKMTKNNVMRKKRKNSTLELKTHVTENEELENGNLVKQWI